MGCSKFYIHDHNSSIPIRQQVAGYIATGLVEYDSSFSKANRPQLVVYNHCIRQYSHKHKWIGMFDADEYIVVVNKTEKIPDVLRRYDAYGGVVLQWKLFGSSGHVLRPEGGILKNYNKCHKNFHIKSIVNSKYAVKAAGNAHSFKYQKGYYAVDTNYTKSVGPWHINATRTPPSYAYDVMYMNHYNLKSRADFEAKIRRGDVTRVTPLAMSYFEDMDRLCTEDCGYLQMPSE